MLQKSTISIPLGLGLDTKTDDKLVQQGQFNLINENVSFNKVGAVIKRQNYVETSKFYYQMGSTVGSGSGQIDQLDSLASCSATLGNSIVLKNPQGNYYYKHDNDYVYTNEYKIPECKVDATIIYAPRTSIDSTDCMYDPSEGVLAITGRDQIINNTTGTDGSPFILYDTNTKTTLECLYGSNALGGEYFGYARASYTRVSGASYYYHVFTNSNQTMRVNIYDKFGQVFTPLSFSNILSDGTTTAKKGPIAICNNPGNTVTYIIVPTTNATQGRFVAVSGSTTAVNVTFSMIGTGWKSATAKFDTASGNIYLCYVQDSGQATQIIFNTAGTNLSSANLLGATACLSVAYDQDTINRVFINEVSHCFYHQGGVGGAKTLLNRNSKLYTDKLTLTQSQVLVAIDDFGQSTYFGMDFQDSSGETTFSRLTTSTGRMYSPLISRVSKIDNNSCFMVLPRLLSGDGVDIAASKFGIQIVKFDLSQNYKSNSRSIIGKNLHFQGGFVTEFDGEQAFENGFHLRPKDPGLDVTTAGSLTGTYFYRVVFKYIDKNGQVTRSEPSDSTSTFAITSKSVIVQVLSATFGRKMRDVTIEVYRTLNGQSNYYFVSETRVDMYSATYFFITDNASDNSISDNELLYTTGDVLANNPAPSNKFLFQGGNRLFAGGLEDGNEIAYSKKKLFGESVNFSDFFRIRFDTSQYNIQGDLTAGAYMDNKVILFKENSAFYFVGDGPNELGANDTFTSPDLISSDAGCTDPRSVVNTPVGVMFKGNKGIYLLDRGMTTRYVGAGVELYNDYQITSAVHVDRKNEVVFTGINGANSVLLVYNYYTEQWSVSRVVYAVDGDLLSGNHVVLNGTNGVPSVQNGSTYLENGVFYPLKVGTPWIKLSGIQDFSRIWSCEIVGKFKSAHTLRVVVYTDYKTTPSQTRDILPLVTDNQYQYRVHIKDQKCESIKFEIYDLNSTGESMELSAITLEVGVKKGSMKLGATRKY